MRRLILFISFIPLWAFSQGSWTQQTSTTYELLRSVSFVDNQTGWVAGDNGAIRKTENGGQSWTVQSAGVNVVFEAVQFIDPDMGWLAGNSGTILKSQDGGQTWIPQSGGVTNHLRSIFFIDQQTGWAVGSSETIIATRNGGSSWMLQNAGSINNLRSVFFVDALNGWAVGDSGKIFHTSDGGNTWTEQNSGTTRILTTIYFVNAHTGWVTGTSGTLLKTIDGGQTWTQQASSTNAGLYALYFPDENIGWAAGSDGVIVHSTNGGETWQTQSSGTGNWIWSLSFADPNNGWASGWAGTLLNYSRQPPLEAPLLSYPENHAGEVPLKTTFAWQQAAGAESYRLQISTTYAFTTKFLDQYGITDTTYTVENLPNNTKLYWRVIAANDDGSSQWSEVWNFTSLLVSIDDLGFHPEGFRLRHVFPNPFRDHANFRVDLFRPGTIGLEILDFNGRQVFVLPTQIMETGSHQLSWQPEKTGAGTYFYRMSFSPLHEPEKSSVRIGKLLFLK